MNYDQVMDFSQPFGGILPGARGAVLAVLLRTGAPLTGRRAHALVSGQHSLSAVQQALRDLEQLGLITTQTVGRAGVHRINEQHEAIAHLRAIRSPLEMLKQVVATTVTDAQAVVVFGSVGRGDAHRDVHAAPGELALFDQMQQVALNFLLAQRVGTGAAVVQVYVIDGDRGAVPRQREVRPAAADSGRFGRREVNAVGSADATHQTCRNVPVAGIAGVLRHLHAGHLALERGIEPGDVVVIAGKGHETYQYVGDRVIHFDDKEEAEYALKKRYEKRS